MRITSTVSPLIPDPGARARLGLTVKKAEAKTLLVPPTASILWLPLTASGTVKVAVALPVGEAVAVATAVDALVVSYHLTVIVSPAAYPPRATVTDVPTSPDAGDKLRLEVTVKVDEAVGPLAPDAVTVCAP